MSNFENTTNLIKSLRESREKDISNESKMLKEGKFSNWKSEDEYKHSDEFKKLIRRVDKKIQDAIGYGSDSVEVYLYVMPESFKIWPEKDQEMAANLIKNEYESDGYDVKILKDINSYLGTMRYTVRIQFGRLEKITD